MAAHQQLDFPLFLWYDDFTNQNNMQTKIIILENGQHLLAQVEDFLANSWNSPYPVLNLSIVSITRPCIFVVEDPPSVTEQKAFNVSIYPWCPLSKGPEIKIKFESILSIVDPAEGLEKMYRETVMKEETPDGE